MHDPATSAGAPVLLAANLDIVAAGPLREELLQRRGAPLELVGAGVEQIGGLCLQVLLAARETWAADAQPFALTQPSPALSQMLATLGAHDLAGPAEDPAT